MPRFHVDVLRPLGVALLRAAGATEEEADLVMEHEIAALLSGEANHGIDLGTRYVPAMLDGTLHPGTPFEIVKETETTLLVDGHMNFGHYVSHHVMNKLIEKARTSHVAAASIRYQGHVGRLIDYTAMAAEAGMIGLMMCDGAWGPKFVAPWGGVERRIGVNPFSMALPSAQEGTVGFDMTTGSVSMTKVFRAKDEGRSIPEGWIIDKDGNPTTDPNDFFAGGSALPLGSALQGHKGYALGFMVEVLADVLSGMEHRDDPSRPWPIVDGSFIAVFDVNAFRPLGDFQADLGDFIDYVKSSKLAPGSPGIFYPGERSAQARAERLRTGIDIPEDVWEEILGFAEQLGVTDQVPTASGLPGDRDQ